MSDFPLLTKDIKFDIAMEALVTVENKLVFYKKSLTIKQQNEIWRTVFNILNELEEKSES